MQMTGGINDVACENAARAFPQRLGMILSI
jgi:hypothetical protein